MSYDCVRWVSVVSKTHPDLDHVLSSGFPAVLCGYVYMYINYITLHVY